jgi:NACalpha-BTF3-like transcription factor
MSIKKSNRGQAIDMSSLVLTNEEAVAVGNMKVNARGDQLDTKGNVVKTKTEQAQAYYQNNPKAAVKTVSIKDAVDVSATKTMEQPVTEKPKTQKTAKPKAKQPKMKEVELPNGDIELVQETEE